MSCKTNKHYHLISSILAFTAFFSIFANFSIYYFSGSLGLLLLFSIFIFLFYNLYKINLIDNKKWKYSKYFLLGWFVIYCISIFSTSEFIPFIWFLYIIFGFILLVLKDEVQITTVRIFLKLYCLLLTLSIIEFIIYYATGISIIKKIVIRSNGQQFYNLLFNVVKITPFPRFQSLADEPGLIGTLNAFILFSIGNNKRYKYYTIIIWISGILTFSLAFYALSFIKLISSKISIRMILPIFLGACIVGYFAYDIFEKKIYDRLQLENIDNRSTYLVDKEISNSVETGSILFGHGFGFHEKLGDGEAEDGGAGAKIFLLEYGIIGLLFVLFFYSLLFFKNNNKLKFENIIFTIIFWISFYQRQTIDRPYTMIVIVMYLCITSYLITPYDTSKKFYSLKSS